MDAEKKPYIGSGDGALQLVKLVEQEYKLMQMCCSQNLTITKTSDLCTNILDLRAKPLNKWQDVILNLMRDNHVGAWPISLERSYKLEIKEKTELRTELNERLKYTVLFILKRQKSGRLSSAISPQSPFVFYENQMESSVSPTDIIGIVVPKPLLLNVTAAFLKVPIYPVDFEQQSIVLPWFETAKYWPSKQNTNVKSVLYAPDFVAGIEQFCRDTGIRTCETHVLRLPTLMDTEYGLSNTLSLYQKSAQPIRHARELKEFNAARSIQRMFRGCQVRKDYFNYKTMQKQAIRHLTVHDLNEGQKALDALKSLKAKLFK